MEINAYTFCVILIFLKNFFQSFVMMFFGIFHFLPVSSGRNPFLPVSFERPGKNRFLLEVTKPCFAAT